VTHLSQLTIEELQRRNFAETTIRREALGTQVWATLPDVYWKSLPPPRVASREL
jgi:hypothetical protein